MNYLHRPTLAEQSARIAFGMFFAGLKALFIVLFLMVSVLVVGQSTIAPVSVRLLTTYAMEYAVTRFKPYRGYFPQPYLIQLETK